jgi:hypothetical protein
MFRKSFMKVTGKRRQLLYVFVARFYKLACLMRVGMNENRRRRREKIHALGLFTLTQSKLL